MHTPRTPQAAQTQLMALPAAQQALGPFSLQQLPALSFTAHAVGAAAKGPSLRLIRLEEINEERHQAYRQALANVYASLDPDQAARLFYLLDGGPTGVTLYFGVVASAEQADLHEGMKNLRSALDGQLPGINFGAEVTSAECDALLQRLGQSAHQGLLYGVPTGPGSDPASQEQSFQGLDRLVRALQSGSAGSNESHWQLAVISQPLTRAQVRELLEQAYAMASQLAAQARTSVQASGNSSRQKSASIGTSEATGSNEGTSDTRGKNEGASDTKSWGKSSGSNNSSSSSGENSGGSQAKNRGTSESRTDSKGSSSTKTDSSNDSLSDTQGSTLGVTQEVFDKRAQHQLDYLDKQLIARLQKGLTKGLFHSAVFLAAENQSTFQRLKQAARATFQGAESTFSPLQVHELTPQVRGALVHMPTLAQALPDAALLFHSLHQAGPHQRFGSLLTADELAIVAGLPQHELQGIRRRKTVAFAVALPTLPAQQAIELGSVIDCGRAQPHNPVRLAKTDLNKHVFVTGVTGAGKTTTCLNLLLESDLPFLVIEPAKTEYRALAPCFGQQHPDYYRPNGEAYQSLRLNPLALLHPHQRIKSHAGFLKNVFAAVFPMEASMPMMVEAAILAAYEEKGWDLDANEFLPGGNAFDPATRAWPTLSEMIRQLDRIIPSYGLGREFEEKYRGSLVSRLRSLTDGTLGQVLDVPQSLDFQALLQRRVVIELEELQSGEEKALLMALLLGCLNQAIREQHRLDPAFRHLTLIEEAHRLLARPEPGDRAAAMAVEAFADMLAEVRKYGAGLIIADQIPAKLIPDIIKNTHTKIVHRLFAEDDRRTMGEAMMMDDAQRNFLPNLATGAAIVFCGGWHAAAHTAIHTGRAHTEPSAPSAPSEPPRFCIEASAQKQLWRERARYYPQLCRLDWLSLESDKGDKGNEPATLAEFVTQTRRAQNQLLHILPQLNDFLSRLPVPAQRREPRQQPMAERAYSELRKWLHHWQPLAQPEQARYAQWHGAQPAPEWPKTLLAAAWLALLLDANPRLQPQQQQDVTPLYPSNPAERAHLASTSQSWLELLGRSPDLATLRSELQQWRKDQPMPARDLQAHWEHLSHFKAF